MVTTNTLEIASTTKIPRVCQSANLSEARSNSLCLKEVAHAANCFNICFITVSYFLSQMFDIDVCDITKRTIGKIPTMFKHLLSGNNHPSIAHKIFKHSVLFYR